MGTVLIAAPNPYAPPQSRDDATNANHGCYDHDHERFEFEYALNDRDLSRFQKIGFRQILITILFAAGLLIAFAGLVLIERTRLEPIASGIVVTGVLATGAATIAWIAIQEVAATRSRWQTGPIRGSWDAQKLLLTSEHATHLFAPEGIATIEVVDNAIHLVTRRAMWWQSRTQIWLPVELVGNISARDRLIHRWSADPTDRSATDAWVQADAIGAETLLMHLGTCYGETVTRINATGRLKHRPLPHLTLFAVSVVTTFGWHVAIDWKFAPRGLWIVAIFMPIPMLLCYRFAYDYLSLRSPLGNAELSRLRMMLSPHRWAIYLNHHWMIPHRRPDVAEQPYGMTVTIDRPDGEQRLYVEKHDALLKISSPAAVKS